MPERCLDALNTEPDLMWTQSFVRVTVLVQFQSLASLWYWLDCVSYV